MDVATKQDSFDSLRRALEEREDVSCLLDSELRFTYCNPAWDRFALENQGESASSQHVIGTCLLDVAEDVLQRFYIDMFEVVASSGKPFDFDYECSSADRYRMFRMRVSPIVEPAGFMVVHSLRVEAPHTRKVSNFDIYRYRDTRGIIMMCCHCRRTRRADSLETWDWVPFLLNNESVMISHGLCQVCRVYYYPQRDGFPRTSA